MSLLEDVFLQDEANEAQELERIIEGDEFEGRPRSDSDENSEKEDEAEEDKRRVDPNTTKTRRVIKNPRFILNPARLTGPRGIQVIPDHFKDFKFKGKGHEREDLDLVLKKLEHWAYRLYPKFQFEDCLKKIETLGKKRPVMVHLHKIRSDQYLTEETVVQKDSSDEEPAPEDEFDKLLQQQIELARSTPAPGSVKKVVNSPIKENRSLIMPKAVSSPSISEEQRERMLRNRKLAEERRLARLKNLSNTNINNSQNHSQDFQEIPATNNYVSNNDASNDDASKNDVSNNDSSNKAASNNDASNNDEENINDTETVEGNTEIAMIRHKRSNIIDSSDEDEISTVNESIRVDVHYELENDKILDKIDDNTEKSLTSNSNNDLVRDNAKESNDEIEITSDNSHKDESNLIESEINNDEVNKMNTQNSDSVDEISMEDDNKVGDTGSSSSSNNQEIEKNQNDNCEDLMDLVFSEEF